MVVPFAPPLAYASWHHAGNFYVSYECLGIKIQWATDTTKKEIICPR